MDVTLVLLCDSANVTAEGKLNILGQFDTITAAAFPVVHPLMHLVLRMNATPAEAGENRNLTIRLVDADGHTIGEVSGPLMVPQLPGDGTTPALQTIIPFPNVTFPKPGSYAFHVLIDRDDKSSVRLSLVTAEHVTEAGNDS